MAFRVCPARFPIRLPAYGQGSCLITTPLTGGSSTTDFRLRQTVGASILWQSPLGPIRFDYAVATMKSPYDVTQRFRFSGGTSF